MIGDDRNMKEEYQPLPRLSRDAALHNELGDEWDQNIPGKEQQQEKNRFDPSQWLTNPQREASISSGVFSIDRSDWIGENGKENLVSEKGATSFVFRLNQQAIDRLQESGFPASESGMVVKLPKTNSYVTRKATKSELDNLDKIDVALQKAGYPAVIPLHVRASYLTAENYAIVMEDLSDMSDIYEVLSAHRGEDSFPAFFGSIGSLVIQQNYRIANIGGVMDQDMGFKDWLLKIKTDTTEGSQKVPEKMRLIKIDFNVSKTLEEASLRDRVFNHLLTSQILVQCANIKNLVWDQGMNYDPSTAVLPDNPNTDSFVDYMPTRYDEDYHNPNDPAFRVVVNYALILGVFSGSDMHKKLTKEEREKLPQPAQAFVSLVEKGSAGTEEELFSILQDPEVLPIMQQYYEQRAAKDKEKKEFDFRDVLGIVPSKEHKGLEFNDQKPENIDEFIERITPIIQNMSVFDLTETYGDVGRYCRKVEKGEPPSDDFVKYATLSPKSHIGWILFQWARQGKAPEDLTQEWRGNLKQQAAQILRKATEGNTKKQDELKTSLFDAADEVFPSEENK